LNLWKDDNVSEKYNFQALFYCFFVSYLIKMKHIAQSALITILTLFNTLIFAQSYNKKLVVQLDTILQTDQQYRSIKNASPQQDEINMHKQGVIDIANLAKVEKIIARYGYPGKSIVGEKHQSTVFLVIQHNDTETQQKYLPLLTAAAEKGELRASSLAILIDRVRTGRGQKQLYGSQLHETKSGIKLYPIEDEAKVNMRRAKVGLQPLEVYLKDWKINYKVPTATHTNPADMYYIAENREVPAVEAIGGDELILTRLQYPAKAKEANITGAVTVEFTVDKDGSTKNISVVKGLGYGCDEEAMRVIKEARYSNKSGEDHDLRMKLPFPYEKK
jgi:TonB family protein